MTYQSRVYSWWQTFQNRLVEVIDQAQHFAALGPAGGGGQSGDVALMFREGLGVTERVREFFLLSSFRFPPDFRAALQKVFLLAQESAKKTKQWYEPTDSMLRE